MSLETQKQKNKREKFIEAVKPLIKWMNENNDICCPHSKIVVTPTNAVLYSGEISFNTEEFLLD